MTPAKARAIWAIYVWCRRTDELVDGPNAPRMTPAALDRWEERLEAVFEGRPYDILDAALTDTVSRFAVDIQPFRDMVREREGRYERKGGACDGVLWGGGEEAGVRPQPASVVRGAGRGRATPNPPSLSHLGAPETSGTANGRFCVPSS